VSGYEIPPKAFPAQVVNRNLAISSPVCYGKMGSLLDIFQEAGAPPRIVKRGAATIVVHNNGGAMVRGNVCRVPATCHWRNRRADSLRAAWGVADTRRAEPLHYDFHGVRARLGATAVVAFEAECPLPYLERLRLRARESE